MDSGYPCHRMVPCGLLAQADPFSSSRSASVRSPAVQYLDRKRPVRSGAVPAD